MIANQLPSPQSLVILGRQPALGIAELESLYGADTLRPFGKQACLLSLPTEQIDFNRLGGTVRLARLLTELPSTDWTGIEKYLIAETPGHAAYVKGKLSFGISIFGLKVAPKQIAKTALSIKKAIKNTGYSVRMVPHDKTELGSATVLYNKLTSGNGWELLIVSDGKTAYLAQTTRIQDIDAYAARDQARPYRDARVGMLPPKLAQIIINLAVGQISHESRVTSHEKLQTLMAATSQLKTSNSRLLVLDPFCGTGVLLQEATLMNYDVYGSDLEPRMIQYSIDNLSWLDSKYPEAGDYRRVEIGDATTHNWKLETGNSKLFVASETFLGQPLSILPNNEHLSKIIYEANLVTHKFLLNIAGQIKSGTRLCLAVPTWRGKHEFLHLPMLDHLTEMGYTRIKFDNASNEDLIYHREGQVVGRELLVLKKN